MEKIDRRIKRTHKLMTNALIVLSISKGYDAVTIKDITDEADISYSTFFRHYPDKDSLLMSIAAGIIEELRDLLRAQQPAEASGAVLFQHVESNQALYRVLLGGLHSSAIVQQLQSMIVNEVLHGDAIHKANNIPPEIAANHVATSALALVKWWLDHAAPYPPERMGMIYAQLVVGPVNAQQNGIS